MLINGFWFSVMTNLVRFTSLEISVFMIVFLRNIFALPMVATWLYKPGRHILKTKHIKLHAVRGIVAITAMSLWFFSVSIMNISEAVALSFTTPLFTAIIAVLILGEKIGIQRTIALLVGFTGVLLITRPDAENLNFFAFTVLITTILWAISNTLAKKASRDDSPRTIVFYLTIFMIPPSIPLAVIYWETPTLQQVLLIALIALVSNLSHLALSNALSKTDITVVLPFDFNRLIFSGTFAYIIFADKITFWTVIGALIILTSSVYIAYREAKIKRQANKFVVGD